MENPIPADRDPLVAELLEEIQQIPAVDAHEHLPPESEHLAAPHDVFRLFEHYCRGDLVAAGARDADFAVWQDRTRPIPERWERFEPFFDAIRTASYARSALLVVRDLLEIPELDASTCVEASRRLEALNRPGIYDEILRTRCNIAACIQCWQWGNGPFPDYFYHLAPSPLVIDLAGESAVKNLETASGKDIYSLDDAVQAMEIMVEKWRAHPKVVGIKSGHAYNRDLAFRRPNKGEAARAFDRVRPHPQAQADPGDVRVIQDYLMFELAARAESAGVPLVFHTGLQAGNFGRVTDADPLLLQDLIRTFPRARFDLYHAGMPWFREIAVLAKYFPGVHLNLAWSHIIDAAQARTALSEWLDMLPNTKIFGFGGDYAVVEKVYGHITIARRNIAEVLAEKIRSGVYSRQTASHIAHRLMRDNAARFYGLDLASLE